MPIILAVLTKVQGKSQIEETIFSNRYMAAPELNRMGAKITIKKNKAIIIGQKKLNSADSISSDLRTSFSIILRNQAGSTHAMTLVGGTGVTLDGDNTNTVAATKTRQFIGRVTNIGSGSEAITVYSMGEGVH